MLNMTLTKPGMKSIFSTATSVSANVLAAVSLLSKASQPRKR